MATLTSYRQYVAKELGLFLSGTAGTSTTGQLVDPTWPVTSSLVQNDLYQDAFLFRPAAVQASDKVRVVQTYTPSAGSLTPDTVWTNAPTGEAYELHGVIEPLVAMKDLINEALKRCFVIVELTVPTIVNQQRHQLIAGWDEEPTWVRQVGWLGPQEDRNLIDPYRRTVRGRTAENGTGFWLEHPGYAWTSGEIIYVQAVKRAYDQCSSTTSTTYADGVTTLGSNTVTSATAGFAQTDIGASISGAGIPPSSIIIAVASATSCTMSGDATATASGVSITLGRLQSGLVGESDTAMPDVEWVGAAALIEAWRRYSQVLETGAKGRILDNRKEAAARFQALTSQHFVLPPMTFRPLGYGGPRVRSIATLGGY